MLEKKKNQAEEFYKSDSDGEDHDDYDWTPETKDEEVVAEETLNSSAATENKDGKIGTESHQILYTASEERNDSVGTEEVKSLCAATDLVGDDALPDLNEPLIDSTTQKMESQEDRCESSVPTIDVASLEDEGLCTSKENTQNELSTSLNTKPSGFSLNKQHSENSSLVIECVDHKIEDLKNESVRESTEGSDGGEEITIEWEKCDTRKSIGKDEFKTPKLNLLASKLPEDAIKKIMAVTPRLSIGKEGDFIDLEESSTPRQNPGVEELMERFVRHSSVKRRPAEKKQFNLK